MDAFDDVQKCMLSKEWLVKVDNETTTPYLLKFHASGYEIACSLMITDTKLIWFETLTSNQLARRWRECNPLKSRSDLTSQEEESWRKDVLKSVSAAHTIGNFAEMSFEVVKTLYSDFAFELRLEDFVFRWETNMAGHQNSASVISTQIIMPLMSTAHLAFNSSSCIGDMSGSNLEAAVDKLGRAARRTPGMHTRNAISRPRLATTIQRMTAMLNFLVELPNIHLDVEKVEITSPDSALSTVVSEGPTTGHSSAAIDIEMGDCTISNTQPKNVESPGNRPKGRSLATPRAGTANTKTDDSATEDSDGEDLILNKSLPPLRPQISRSSAPVDKKEVDPLTLSSEMSKLEAQKPASKSAAPDPSPPPARLAATKTKRAALSSSDSEGDDKASAGPPTRRGARQPIKRGGRRF